MRYALLFIAMLMFSPLVFSDQDLRVGGIETSSLDWQSYYFGRVQVNSMNSVRFRVVNTGETALHFSSSYISGIGYSAYHSCENGLEPKAKCEVEIRYWPPFEGFHRGRFELYFEGDSGVVIDLSGEAYRWP